MRGFGTERRTAASAARVVVLVAVVVCCMLERAAAAPFAKSGGLSSADTGDKLALIRGEVRDMEERARQGGLWNMPSGFSDRLARLQYQELLMSEKYAQGVDMFQTLAQVGQDAEVATASNIFSEAEGAESNAIPGVLEDTLIKDSTSDATEFEIPKVPETPTTVGLPMKDSTEGDDAAPAPSVMDKPEKLDPKLKVSAWSFQKEQVFWNGNYLGDLPAPVPKGFGGEPSAKARGKFAYVTMITPKEAEGSYICMALSLMTSLKASGTKKHDLVVAVLQPADSRATQAAWTEEELPTVIGDEYYHAFKSLGVSFRVWQELDTKDRVLAGWGLAFSKLQVWREMIDYEKVAFLDADTMALKNLDHLFSIDSDFVAASTWNCQNTNSPKTPSGGFWVLRPSTKTWTLMEKYLAGPDPCGQKWYQGDMTLLRYMFLDARSWGNPDKNTAATPRDMFAHFDGDVKGIAQNGRGRESRCQSSAVWPERIDTMYREDGSTEVAPYSLWHALDETYDLLVGVCHLDTFVKPDGKDDRFGYASGGGDKGWGRSDTHSVHFSCGEKPKCYMDAEFMAKAEPCQRDMFKKWQDLLFSHREVYKMLEKKHAPVGVSSSSVTDEGEGLQVVPSQNSNAEAQPEQRADEEPDVKPEEEHDRNSAASAAAMMATQKPANGRGSEDVQTTCKTRFGEQDYRALVRAASVDVHVGKSPLAKDDDVVPVITQADVEAGYEKCELSFAIKDGVLYRRYPGNERSAPPPRIKDPKKLNSLYRVLELASKRGPLPNVQFHLDTGSSGECENVCPLIGKDWTPERQAKEGAPYYDCARSHTPESFKAVVSTKKCPEPYCGGANIVIPDGSFPTSKNGLVSDADTTPFLNKERKATWYGDVKDDDLAARVRDVNPEKAGVHSPWYHSSSSAEHILPLIKPCNKNGNDPSCFEGHMRFTQRQQNTPNSRPPKSLYRSRAVISLASAPEQSNFFDTLLSNSVAIKQESFAEPFYERFFDPNRHYLKVDKALSNLKDKVEFAMDKSRDKQLETVANSASKRAQLLLDDGYIGCYYHLIFSSLGDQQKFSFEHVVEDGSGSWEKVLDLNAKASGTVPAKHITALH